MDRRHFLKNAGLAGSAAAASTALATPAIAQSKRVLTMVTSWGRGLAGVHDAAQMAADTINAMDVGLEIELKASGELVGGFEVFDAVSSGQADMYHAADYYFVGQHPAFAFFTAVPFGMTATELNTWYYNQGGKELHHELGAEFNLKSFLCGNTGAQAGGWFRKEITSVEDFQGLKFRMPGLGGQALSKLGASVQNIPGAEVYQALATGALDGTEWIGPWADEAAGFQEITKFFYNPGFHEPGAGLSLVTNLEVFEELTPGQQAAIEAAAGYTNSFNLSLYLGNNGAALQRLINDNGVQTKVFSQEIFDAFGQASQAVYSDFIDDPMFRKVYESVVAGMAQTASWMDLSDNAYLERRNKFLGI